MSEAVSSIQVQPGGWTEFNADSTIRQVLCQHPDGARLLYEHGYEVGEGFLDVLSQHQSLRTAAWSGRLRDLSQLLERLNRGPEGP
jgi:hypothetical protein